MATTLALLAIAAAPAQAGKGWAFKETFGETGTPPKFGNDRSLAVDGAGRLLVFDKSGTPSVSRWNPDGSAADFSALGTNVIDGKRVGAVNECPVVAADCDETPGNAGIGDFFRNQIAVDNTGGVNGGNIYVSDAGADVINSFSASGAFLGRLSACSDQPFSNAEGVAVDGSGAVYFSGAINSGPRIAKYAPAASSPVNGDCVAESEVAGAENLAAGAGPTDGFLFLSSFSSIKIEKRDTATETFGELSYAFGKRLLVAVEPMSGHVFSVSDNEKGVVEYDASGAEEALEVALLEEAGSTVHAIAPAKESGGEELELLYIGRGANEEVDVYKAVKIPEATTGPPEGISGAKATATGTVNPEEVSVTECFFEYGLTEAYGLPTIPCEEYEEGGEWKPLTATAELGTGIDPVPVRAELTGMRANGLTYHYRLVAKGDIGGGQEGTDKGDDETLITQETFTAEPASGIDETEATLNGIVKPEGVPITDCFFEYGTTSEYDKIAKPCVPSVIGAEGDADIPVSATLTGLEPSTIYHYRLVVENGLGLGQIVSADRRFATLGAPGIEAQVAAELDEDSATLQALVNPFGSETTYRFEWGTDESYGNITSLESAGAGSDYVLVSAEISGLDKAAEHHFRLVASNDFGTTEAPDQPFETLNEHDLPDDRAFELVSPADKGPAGNVTGGFILQLRTHPSENGDSFIWPLQNGMPETTAGGWLRMKAKRVVEGGVPQGWASAQVSAPSLIAPPEIDGEGFAPPSILLYAAEDNSCGMLQSYNPLTSDTLAASVELGLHNLYVWREGGGEIPSRISAEEIAYRPARAGEIGYELVTARLPLNPDAGGSRDYFEEDAAEDCSRVYFKSDHEWIEKSSGLYEWEAATGALRDAGLRPDDTPGKDPLDPLTPSAGGAVLGGAIQAFGITSWRDNAVTPDGDAFFTALNVAERPAIFLRSEGGGSVVEISGPEPGAPAAATVGARFEAASPDGSTVLFRANHGLDADPGGSDDEPTTAACGPRSGETDFDNTPEPEPKPCDLYAYDVASEQLTDLTVDTNPEDPLGAALQGTVAVDEDGSHVYFAALGQLTGEGRSYMQNTAGEGRANVYLYNAEAAKGEELSYVTNLRWGELLRGGLMRRGVLSANAQASVDGSRLLYSAASRQNWYEGGGGRVAYLYDAGREEIRCVSCRSDGGPTSVNPQGVVQPLSLQFDLLALRGFSRALSADGRRVFFTSSDALAPGAEAGRPNVYEWEEGQLYFLAIAEPASDKGGLIAELSGYLGMSADGESAFLASVHKLVPQDRDSISDVYTVREDGGIPFSEPPPECQVDESVPLEPNQIYCQGERSAQPGAQGAPSAGFIGPGNPTPNPCARRARRARALAKRAKVLRGKARRARRGGKRGAARGRSKRARRYARAARRNAKAAKRCRRRARAANTSAGGAR